MSDYQYVLSFDPGVSSGIALGRFSETTPYELVEGRQFRGGAGALARWLNGNIMDPYTPGRVTFWNLWDYSDDLQYDSGEVVIVSEKFTPLQGKGFSLTMDAVEPLRGEGVLIALDVMPDYSPDEKTWQRPNQMYFCGGSTLAEKKKRSRAFLKDTGNYRFPKQLGEPDSNDCMSATLHGIAYVMKTLRHEATFTMVTEWTEEYDRMSE